MRWHREEKPIDRFLRGLDRELAQIRWQARLLKSKQALSPNTRLNSLEKFVGKTLPYSLPIMEPSYRFRVPPLVDVASNLAQDWEATDALGGPTKQTTRTGAHPKGVHHVELRLDKLIRYLSAGSLREFLDELPNQNEGKIVLWVTWASVGLGIVAAVALILLVR